MMKINVNPSSSNTTTTTTIVDTTFNDDNEEQFVLDPSKLTLQQVSVSEYMHIYLYTMY